MNEGIQTTSPLLKFPGLDAQIRKLAREKMVVSISAVLDLPGFQNLPGLGICCTAAKFPL